MTKLLRSLVQDTSGATAVEYGLMIVLIALAILVAVTVLGTNVRDRFADPVLNGALS